MLYYVASYPRSGNSWISSLIRNQFLLISSSIYDYDGPGMSTRKWLQQMQERFPNHFEHPRSNWLARLLHRDPLLGRWAFYTLPNPPPVRRKILIPGLKRVLRRDKIRRRLGEDTNPSILKTHDAPFSRYHDGESVIQIVRNPGACLWSYFHFARDYDSRHPSLSELIAGRYGFGDWSKYHRAWVRAAEGLRHRHLLVRFEDLFGRELEFCRRLEAFWGFPIRSKQVRPFEDMHRGHPKLIRSGRSGGWEENYSQRQLQALWSRHGEMMAHFGYAEPDYRLGSEKELH